MNTNFKNNLNMKKFVKIGFVAVFAAIAGYGVYANQKTELLSDLALANVEALANSKESTGNGRLYLQGEYGTGGCITCTEAADTSCRC